MGGCVSHFFDVAKAICLFLAVFGHYFQIILPNGM